jgi:hypothetical protein
VTFLTRFDSVAAAKKMLSSERWQQASKGVRPIDASFTNVADEKSYG